MRFRTFTRRIILPTAFAAAVMLTVPGLLMAQGKGGGGGKNKASLSVSVTPNSFSESSSESDAGPIAAAIGTVARVNSDGDLTVTLSSNDTSEATVQQNVLIRAGASSVDFPVYAVNDDVKDGDQSVTISASATDHSGASASITVLDDDGGDGAGDPPPTYLINWIDDFSIWEVNNDGDSIGEIPSLTGTGTGNISTVFGLYVGEAGEPVVLDNLFSGTAATPRYVFDLSNRLDDGSLYLCGSCDTADGVRGWRMKLEPSTEGLKRVAFSILQPAEGDDTSALKSVNTHGESVGYSYSKQADVRIYTTLYHSDEGTIEIGTLGNTNTFIDDSGKVYACLIDAYGFSYIGSWTPEGSIQTLLHAIDFNNAQTLILVSVNQVGDFLVDAIERRETNQGGTYNVQSTYLYNGTLRYLTDNYDDPYPRFTDLNLFGDLVSHYYVSGKGKNPGRYVNEIYFAAEGVVEYLDNMINETNLQVDSDRWFETLPTAELITDSGLVFGTNEFGETFVLVPVSP